MSSQMFWDAWETEKMLEALVGQCGWNLCGKPVTKP